MAPWANTVPQLVKNNENGTQKHTLGLAEGATCVN